MAASLTSTRMSRDDFKKAKELEELRKTGAAPPELDDDGNMINPHIPQYISQSPWYLNNTRPGLKHQKTSSFAPGTEQTGPTKGSFTEHYQRGRVAAAVPQKFVAGACSNCGATSHKTKDCCERPRKKGAALTGQNIMPAEVVQQLEFSYDGKRDRWNGYDTKEYGKVIRKFELTELERKKKKLAELDEAFELERKQQQEEEEKAKAAAAAAAAAPAGEGADGAAAAASSSSAVESKPAEAAASNEASAIVPGEGMSAASTEARRLRAIKKTEKLKKKIMRAQKAASSNNAADKSKGVRASDSDSDSDRDSDDESDDDDMKDFGEVIQKKDATARMTVRNLRLREDTAKYLRNLDPTSAHYDPKTRSMRENPYTGQDPNQVPYAGDNFVRKAGDTKQIQAMQSFVWEAVERGNEGVHVQALPSQAEKLFQEYQAKKEALKDTRKAAILNKYGAGSGSTQQSLPRELLVPANESYVEYDESGRVVRGAEKATPRTKYQEDVMENGHTAVWGSFYRPAAVPGGNGASWGYACCHQTLRHAICTGAAGKEASRAMTAQLGTRASFKDVEAEREKSAAAASSHAAAAASSSVSASAATPAAAAAASSMDTDADGKSTKRKRRSRSRSPSSSSSASSRSSSSSSGSDSDRRSRKKKDRSKRKSKQAKAAAAADVTSAKNKQGYSSASAVDAAPSERDMEAYHRSRHLADDPLLNMKKDELLDL